MSRNSLVIHGLQLVTALGKYESNCIAEGDVWDCIAEGDVWDCIAEGDVWELWSGELFRTLRSLSSWPSRLLMSDNVATITLNKTTLLS